MRLIIRVITAFSVLAIVLVTGAQAVAVYPENLYNGTSERGFLYDDKKYGDGSLKKFFFMLKIILKLFGKH